MKAKYANVALLLIRLQTGLLLMTHGIPKLINFTDRMDNFANPFGLGSTLSLALVVFAEVLCSFLLIIGWKARWATIPIIFTMLVVIFYAHWDDPFGRKELPLMFLGCAVALLLAGPGKYSLDSRSQN